MSQRDEENLHPDDIRLWRAVERATFRLAKNAGLKLDAVRPMPLKSCSDYYGLCLREGRKRTVFLSLRDWNRVNGFALRPPTYVYVQTIAHEVAHLIDEDHGPRFMRTFAKMLTKAARLDILLDLEQAM